MFDHDEIAERQAATARRMAARLEAMADGVFAQTETITEPEKLQAAALTVERLYRGVRLCMAYEVRVARDHRRAQRELDVEVDADHKLARQHRAQRLKSAVGQAFMSEYEADQETSEDPEDDLIALYRRINALEVAITDLEPSLNVEADDGKDFAAEVQDLHDAVLQNLDVQDIVAKRTPPPPPPTPPRRRSG